jgi:CHAT domain-containing protein
LVFGGGGGNITISGNGILHLQDGSIGSSVAKGDDDAGNITIDQAKVLIEDGSTIAASVVAGAGGNVVITAPEAVGLSPSSHIEANALDGSGGHINITTNAFVGPVDNVVASALGGPEFQGTVEISSPEVDALAGANPLEVQFLDAAARIRPACASRTERGGASGSFTVARRPGIPTSPEALLVAFEPIGASEGAADSLPQVSAAPPGDAVQLAMNSLVRGTSAFRGGHFSEASESLEEASTLYAEIGDPETRLEALAALAEAQQADGRFAESLATVSEALRLAEELSDVARRAGLHGGLGNAYLALGDAEAAERELRRGAELAREAQDPARAAQLLNNLGNLHAALGQSEEALAAYQESARLAGVAERRVEQAKALSNAARAAIDSGENAQAAELLASVGAAAGNLEPTHEKAAVWIHLAGSHERLARAGSADAARQLLAAHAALTQAILLARELNEPRTLSYGLGNLGALYADESRTEEALLLTRRALAAAEEAGAPDLLYRWHWQEGRLLWSKGQAEEALRSYRRAVAILAEIRPESRAQYGSAAAEFRRSVAPVYVDFVDALVQSSGMVQDPGDAQTLLVEARAAMEQLKAAELRDYFRDECVAELEEREVDIDRVSRESRAAVIYPILLPDRLELLVSLPSGVERHTVPVEAQQVRQTAEAFRRGILDRTSFEFVAPATVLHGWLVAPYADRLAEERVATLVFVPDGVLRTVPMAALYDGEKFLTERYAVAVAPGLSLVDPRPLEPEKARMLLAGLSESVQGFPALPAAQREIAAIHALYGGEVLMDEEFEARRFESELAREEPSVVHVSSHAVFTGDPSTSFLLTHDDRLTMDRLSEVVAPAQFRERPLELLALSACETAAGDERAALGLAGVAVRAGARSALGSLWAVQDEATYEVVVAFYEALKQPGVSKAEALRRAQVKLLADRGFAHPFYWSPFLLISNWL